MSKYPAVDRVMEELDKLLEAAATEEERNNVWEDFVELWDAEIAKRRGRKPFPDSSAY